MNVESICTRHVISLDARESIARAAQLMREHHVGCVVVTESAAGATQVVGVVTDRDLAIEVLARGADASQEPVSTLVQGPPAGIGAQAGLTQAVEAMLGAGTRRLLVHDAQGQLVGLLSFDDLLPGLVAPLAGLAQVLQAGLQREAQTRGAIAAPARPVLHVPAMGTLGWQTPLRT